MIVYRYIHYFSLTDSIIILLICGFSVRSLVIVRYWIINHFCYMIYSRHRWLTWSTTCTSKPPPCYTSSGTPCSSCATASTFWTTYSPTGMQPSSTKSYASIKLGPILISLNSLINQMKMWKNIFLGLITGWTPMPFKKVSMFRDFVSL